MAYLTEQQLHKLSTERLLNLYKARRVYPSNELGDEYYDDTDAYCDLIQSILGGRPHVGEEDKVNHKTRDKNGKRRNKK